MKPSFLEFKIQFFIILHLNSNLSVEKLVSSFSIFSFTNHMVHLCHLNSRVMVCVFSINISYEYQLNLLHMYLALVYLRVCQCKMCKYIMNGAGRRPDTVLLLFYRLLFFIVFSSQICPIRSLPALCFYCLL